MQARGGGEFTRRENKIEWLEGPFRPPIPSFAGFDVLGTGWTRVCSVRAQLM